jgi:hypothetical protein
LICPLAHNFGAGAGLITQISDIPWHEYCPWDLSSVMTRFNLSMEIKEINDAQSKIAL